jgi:hypothetical protein
MEGVNVVRQLPHFSVIKMQYMFSLNHVIFSGSIKSYLDPMSLYFVI